MEKQEDEHYAAPYARIIIKRFETAKDKLLAMSTEPGLNRMKVGDCSSDSVKYFIYRISEDTFDVRCTDSINFSGKNRKKFKSLTADEVVELVDRHNISSHEMFEILTELERNNKQIIIK